MHLMLVSHTAEQGGAEISMERLARALRPSDEAELAFASDGPMIERATAAGLRAHLLQGGGRARPARGGRAAALISRLVGIVSAGWSLGNLVRARDSDAILPQSIEAMLIAAIARLRARKPVIWYVRENMDRRYLRSVSSSPALGSAKAILLPPFAWLACDGYIAVGSGLLAGLRLKGRPHSVIHPGVDPLPATPGATERREGTPTITMVGRLTEWKGQHIFLRALAQLRQQGIRATIVGGPVPGESDYEEGLHRLSRELGLTDQVTFVGHTDDPAAYMREADVLVHASVEAEPFGKVIVEGMQAGCAVIASNTGGPAEIITDGLDGLLVEPGSAGALSRALERLLADPAERERLASAGQERAEAFTMASTAREVRQFTAQFLAPAGRPIRR